MGKKKKKIKTFQIKLEGKELANFLGNMARDEYLAIHPDGFAQIKRIIKNKHKYTRKNKHKNIL